MLKAEDRCGVEGCRRRWEFRSREPGRSVVVYSVQPGGLLEQQLREQSGTRRVEDPSAPDGVRVEIDVVETGEFPAPRVESSGDGVSVFCRGHFTVLGMVGAVGVVDARWWLEAGDG